MEGAREIRSNARTLPWILICAIAFFALAGLYQITLPGLYGDEALQATPAARVAVGVQGHAWPTFVMSYIGPVKTYVLALSFLLFGVSVPVLRATTLACGLVGVIFAYLFLRLVFDRRVAAIGVVLLASDTSLILFSRADWGPVAISFAAKTIGLYALARWWRNPREWLAATMAGLSFGAGLLHKADFSWFLIAMPIASVFCSPRLRVALKGKLSGVIFGLIAFAAMASPLILFNIVENWITWAEPRRELAATLVKQYPGEPTVFAAIKLGIAQFPQRLGALRSVIDGSFFPNWTTGPASISLADVHLWLFLIAMGAAMLAFGLRLAEKHQGRLFWPTLGLSIIPVIMFLEILITPSATGPHHSIALYPFPHFIIAVGLACMLSFRRKRFPVGWVLATVLVLGLVAVNAAQITQFHGAAIQTGGRGAWSDAIYTAAEIIDRDYPGETVVTTDWGQRDQLFVVLGGKRSVDFWVPDNDPTREFQAQLDAGRSLFTLFDERLSSVFKEQRQEIIVLLQDPKYDVEWRIVPDRQGTPVILLAKVRQIQPVRQ